MTTRQAERYLLRHGGQVNYVPAHGNQKAGVAVALSGPRQRLGQGSTLAQAVVRAQRNLDGINCARATVKVTP